MGNEGKFGPASGEGPHTGVSGADGHLGEAPPDAGEIHGGIAAPDVRIGELPTGGGKIHGGATPRDPRMGDVDEGVRAHEAAVETRERAAAKVAIEARYRAVGGFHSGLGLITDVDPSRNADGTYRMNTRGGHVIYAPATGDTTAIVTERAKVVFAGLKCFGTQRGGDDDAYVVITIVQPDQWVADKRIVVGNVRAPKDSTYTNVAEGSVNTAGLEEFWAESPQDIIIHSAVLEHDYGDPNAIQAAIKKTIQDGANAVATAVTETPTEVPMDDSTLQGMAIDWLAGIFADWTGAGDDLLGDGAFKIDLKDWYNNRLAPMQTRDGIEYNYKQYCTNGDASYDVMFKVTHETVTVEL